jgi:uncharacterized membrane protein SpoIIM required for sporulation
MSNDLHMIGLVTGRELRDQLRDWRILFPLLTLTTAFPFLMNEVAKQAVSFFAKYGTTLIADRLVPFSVLIIGFFPITISLVVALESFVGEKERGTIEPLLNTPLENWHLYCGKLLVGVITPLIASYLSISVYLSMVSRQQLQMPDVSTLVLLFVLTTVHAILMVSAAIVISVQSTTVRAANLLASFIVIPVAILMQGESALLFWGNERVLWFAVAAVLIMAALLVRLGLAHFDREYLLGREFDSLNWRWMWAMLRNEFRGQAESLRSWYQRQVIQTLRRTTVPLLICMAIAVIGFCGSYYWVINHIPVYLPGATTKDIAAVLGDTRHSSGLLQLRQHLSAWHIILNNFRAVSLLFLSGLVSFSVLGIAAYLVNIGLVGGVLGILRLAGYEPLSLFATGLLPHGLFELPALMLACASVLRFGAVMVTPQIGKSIGQVMLELIADSVKLFVGIVIPLLVIAGIIEAYITPSILLAFLR